MADSSKDIQLRELKDMINDLKKMIKTLQATVDAGNKREEALTQERDNLKEEIDLLRKKLFGTSSEKRTIDIPGQLNFFNEAELEQNPEAVKAEDLEALLPEKTAKKRKARVLCASFLRCLDRFGLLNINARHQPVELPPCKIPDFRFISGPPVRTLGSQSFVDHNDSIRFF